MTDERKRDLLKEILTMKKYNYTLAPDWVFNEIVFAISRPEIPHGEWQQVTAKDGEYYCYHKCTNCGQTIESGFDNPPLFNYCPNCGARMQKEGEEE